ncbi:MAG: hypothetical protein DCF15_11530 [Phormidesmis priestleyi]|uniref:Uncharacterized protein n=1 Tax=Phormidesmis priestleyi TaxID=268141 RepID=A0A2W4XC16_9CYAN|nr:MAG: hypothetical protein DCF15_11530 [Phormidesmis priestleyi]
MANWIEQLGDRNPQFLRECRGRLKPRSVMAAVGLSLIFQFLLYISTAEIGTAIRVSDQLNICRTLTFVIPYGLFVLGGYYLVDDLAKEEKSGTLNFIRLSPRPAFEILLGKLLGVPLLPVILIVIATPLHIISGLLGGVSPQWFLSYYLLVAAGSAFVFSLALLFGIVGSRSALGKQQALSAVGFAGLALIVIAPAFMTWNSFVTWRAFGAASPLFDEFNAAAPIEWLYLPVAANSLVAHLFTIGNLVIATLLVWRILLRKFRVPQATLVSKRLSYIGVFYVNVLAWGFSQSGALSAEMSLAGAVFLLVLNAFVFLGLIFALAPSRQMLLDWLRYRQHTLFDWIWNDSSPSVLAMAINVIIAAGLIVPWLLISDWPISDRGSTNLLSPVPILLATLSIVTNVLIYTTLVQIIFSMRLRSPLIWAVGIVATFAFVPLTIIAILTNGSSDRSGLMIAVWTFLGLPFWQASELGNVSIGISIGWLMQFVVLLLLLTRLARNLKQLASHKQTVSTP